MEACSGQNLWRPVLVKIDWFILQLLKFIFTLFLFYVYHKIVIHKFILPANNLFCFFLFLWRPVLVKIDWFILLLVMFVLKLLKFIFTLFLFLLPIWYFSYWLLIICFACNFFRIPWNIFSPFRRINFLYEFQLFCDGLTINFWFHDAFVRSSFRIHAISVAIWRKKTAWNELPASQ